MTGRIAEISLGMLNKPEPSLLWGVCSRRIPPTSFPVFDRYEDERQIVFGGVFQEELKQEGVQRINEVLFESASVFTNAPISLRNVELTVCQQVSCRRRCVEIPTVSLICCH